jgi:hypothetical protein
MMPSWRTPVFACAGVAAVAALGWLVWSVAAGGDSVISEDGFDWSARRLTARRQIVAQLVPDLRDNPSLVRVIDFALAEQAYHNMVPRHRYATPVRMWEGAFWQRQGIPAILPTSYGTETFDGYQFAFHGNQCESPDENDAPKECESFVYVATPVRPRQLGHGLPPSFALYSADMRIRYHEHGEVPEADDDAIDTQAPTTSAPSTPAPRSALSRIADVIGRVTGTSADAARANEATALRDLRDVARAEQLCRQMMGDRAKYLPPEQLADSGMFARAHIPEPFLPSRFLHATRDGYEFEFIGERLTTESIYSSNFHPVYERFVYVARPLAAGSRTMALYQDGRIFATTDPRTPTPDDEAFDAE